jgi:hypothetical protein
MTHGASPIHHGPGSDEWSADGFTSIGGPQGTHESAIQTPWFNHR